jgi:carbohydrate-selective porin OprB
MAQKFLTDIQMGSGTTVINLVVDPRSTPPSSPTEGQIYYNTTDDVLYYYNGTAFVTFGDITAVLTPSGSAMTGGGTAGVITLQVVVDNSTI